MNYIEIKYNSPLEYLDYDISLYLYETYYPSKSSKYFKKNLDKIKIGNLNQGQLVHSENILTDNNNKLIRNLTDEMFDKDKTIQELKNENESLLKKIQLITSEKNKYVSQEKEIDSLKEKLNEQYKINKQLKLKDKTIQDLKNEIKQLHIDIKNHKQIILKQKCEIITLYNQFYKNKKLKDILLNHNLNEDFINQSFITYKITENTDITKELLKKFIN